MHITRKFIFFILAVLDGLASLIFLLSVPSDPKNVWFLGISPVRFISAGIILVVELILGWAAFHVMRKDRYGEKIENYLTKLLDSPTQSFLLIFILMTGIALGWFFLVSWWLTGEKYQAIYERVAPIIYFEAVFCLQFLFLFRAPFRNMAQGYFLTKQRVESFIKKYKLQPIALLIIVVIFSWVYVSLATYHARVQNQDMTKVDQGAYLSFAQAVYKSGFKDTGDRNRMPLYSFIQALFLNPHEHRQAQFTHGKQVNIVLSLVLLIILFGVISRFLTSSLTTNFILIAAFALYVFKAGYFQSELLFYFLSLVSFIMMTRILVSPSYKLGLATGLVVALAQLTKASMLPMLTIFLGFYVLKMVLIIWQMIKDDPLKRSSYLQQMSRQIGILLCVLICFLGVLYPYIRESKQKYGQYFYNVNSTFYIWYDDWGEVLRGTRAYGDRTGWPIMPAEDIPSFQKYIREHTPTQIEDRLFNGLRKQYENLSRPYTYFNYLAIYSILLLISSIIGAKKIFPLLQENIVSIGFVSVNFVAYLLLYSWYVAINEGYRFTLALFLPILFTCMFALKYIFDQYGTISFKRYALKASTLLHVFNFVVLIFIMIDLVQYLPLQLKGYYFGH
jgi:hypothetical protein